MTQVDSAGQVHACALRVGRLDAGGAPMPGANNGYLTNSFARLTRKVQIEAGATLFPRNACGDVDFSFHARDIPVWHNLELEILRPDPELLEMFASAALITANLGGRTVADGVTTSGSPIITSATAAFTQADVGRGITGTGITGGTTILSVQSTSSATLSGNATATGTTVSLTIAPSATSIGNEAPALNVAPTDGGLSVELWARAVVGSGQAAYLPWWRMAYTRTFWRMSDEEAANAESRQVLIGFAIENPLWGNGPWNDWRQIGGLPNPSTYTLSKAFGKYRTDTIPAIAQPGYVTVPAAA